MINAKSRSTRFALACSKRRTPLPFFSRSACFSLPLLVAKRQQVMRLLSELASEDGSIADHLTDWLGNFKDTSGRKDGMRAPEDIAADADVGDGAPRGDDVERNTQGHACVQAAGPLSDVAREEAELLAIHRNCWAARHTRQGREEEQEMNRVKEQVFGIPASSPFSPMQLQVLRALTSRPPMDVMAVMKAGAGKSLCFHVASVMSGRVTLVVSPFRALIRNHVRTKAGEGGEGDGARATKRQMLRFFALQCPRNSCAAD